MIDCRTPVEHYVLTVIGWSYAEKRNKNTFVKRVEHFRHPENARKVFDTFDRWQKRSKKAGSTGEMLSNKNLRQCSTAFDSYLFLEIPMSEELGNNGALTFREILSGTSDSWTFRLSNPFSCHITPDRMSDSIAAFRSSVVVPDDTPEWAYLIFIGAPSFFIFLRILASIRFCFSNSITFPRLRNDNYDIIMSTWQHDNAKH